MPDDEPFYFNINVLIQNGSELKHAHIMLTSKKLMTNCERTGMIHIDGTYKLVKNHFPVVVLGITYLIFIVLIQDSPKCVYDYVRDS